jgi:dipeptidyl aminopeptidase/acylaminoacyl peptidase
MKIASAIFLAALFVFGSASAANAQKMNLEKVIAGLDKSDCVAVGAGKIKICRYDYRFENKTVEAVVIRPAADGRFPAVLLAPGFDLTARDLIPMGVMLAHENFASVAITPPGFGKSEGKPDFVGPNTIKTFVAGWNKFKAEQFVDGGKMAIYGHSRGGLAAALLAVELKDARAAVLASGIYDFKLATEETRFAGMRERMIAETAMNEQAFKERSAILRMEELKTPVLILHGEQDDKTSVNQAYKLRDKLSALKKDFEIKIYPQAGHALDAREIVATAADFFRRKLKVGK